MDVVGWLWGFGFCDLVIMNFLWMIMDFFSVKSILIKTTINKNAPILLVFEASGTSQSVRSETSLSADTNTPTRHKTKAARVKRVYQTRLITSMVNRVQSEWMTNNKYPSLSGRCSRPLSVRKSSPFWFSKTRSAPPPQPIPTESESAIKFLVPQQSKTSYELYSTL